MSLLNYLMECDANFYCRYALPLIAAQPCLFDLDGFESSIHQEAMSGDSCSKEINSAFEEFERDLDAQYELHPKYGRYVWDIADQWYQKWSVVFSLEHMWNWTLQKAEHEEATLATSERPFTTKGLQPWLNHNNCRHKIHERHQILLENICDYLVDWHQTNRSLALIGACKLTTIPFFPPSWFVDKQRQNHGDYQGLAPSYIARFVPPYRLASVPERWDEVFLKGLTVDPDHQLDMDPELITNTLSIYGLTVHYDSRLGYSRLMMVMKKATYGNLETSLEKEIPVDYNKPRMLALSVTKALKDLHWEYVHGNVHPRNILLNFADYVGELIDITFMQRSRSLQRRHSANANETQTDRTSSVGVGGRWPYVAPEMAMPSSRLTTAADIYALGIILWQLVSRVTFPDNTLVDPFVYRIEPIPGVMKEWEDLYTDCLNTDPSKRPNAYMVYRRLEKLSADVPFSLHTLEYVHQRRGEIRQFLSERLLFDYRSNGIQPTSMLVEDGGHVLTASVTRLVNKGLESYPRLVQKFTF
ncbi:kinase-like domain-containing protein [Phycomyces blakesleeanus]